MLLLDQNVSPRLVQRLADVLPCTHVADVGLDRATDPEVWAYAREHGLAVVTKDVDLTELAVRYGAPPFVVWLRLGNCTTAQMEAAIRHHAGAIRAFIAAAAHAILEVR